MGRRLTDNLQATGKVLEGSLPVWMGSEEIPSCLDQGALRSNQTHAGYIPKGSKSGSVFVGRRKENVRINEDTHLGLPVIWSKVCNPIRVEPEFAHLFPVLEVILLIH